MARYIHMRNGRVGVGVIERERLAVRGRVIIRDGERRSNV